MPANAAAAANPSPAWGAVLTAWLLGVALQLQQAQLWGAGVYVAICAVALVFIAQVAMKFVAASAPVAARLLLWGCCLALGFGSTGWRAAQFAASALPAALEGRDVDVQGLVVGLPQPQAAGMRFQLEPESATLDGQAVVLPARMDVGWYSGWGSTAGGGLELQRQPVAVRPGERWRMRLRLKAPHGNVNPHGFDYELYLWEQGVQASAYVRAGVADPAPQRLGTTWHAAVDAARDSVRAHIVAAVPDRAASALISALVVGDQAAIERADWDMYRATGVAHLVSISGLHVTMFAWLASWLVARGWRGSARACLWQPASLAGLWGGVLLAWAYALFAGWGVPAQRTVLMLLVAAVLRTGGGRWPWPQVWLGACVAVVLWDPWALLQAGFWLSFVAVGVLFATDSGANIAVNTGARARFSHIFREQWVIGLALAPLGFMLFGQVSVVGLLANLLAVPWVTWVLTPLGFLGLLHPDLWGLAAWAAQVLHAVLGAMAQWPLAVWWWPRPPLGVGLLACLGAVVLVFPWSWRMRTLALPLLLPLAWWRPAVPAVGEFALLAADVGQGNAVLVRTQQHTLLFDAGPRYGLETDAGHRVLVPLLQALQWPLDMLVLSHRDTDHVGGAASVLAMSPQATLLSSLEPGHALLAAHSGSRCEAGQRWEWDGVAFSILGPHLDAYAHQAQLPTNAMSCVLRISNGRQTALLVGDIEQAQEAWLVQTQASQLRADVLLVPHHGSKTSSSEGFLDAVQPRFAWVQSGYRNRFGHPAAPVMERYRVRNIVVQDSPHCGAMQWRSELAGQVLCEREVQRRYWQHQVP